MGKYNYFSNLPTITYSETYRVKNLFRRFKFIDPIDEEDIVYIRMANTDTLHSIAYRYYRDQKLWWVLAIMNDIRDIFFEIPLSNEFLNKMSVELSRQKIPVTSTLRLEKDLIITGDVSGRTGRIDSVNSNEMFIYIELTGDYEPLLPADTTFTIDGLGSFTVSPSISSVEWAATVSEKFDELNTDNDNKRIIKIFKPELKNKILSQIEESLNV